MKSKHIILLIILCTLCAQYKMMASAVISGKVYLNSSTGVPNVQVTDGFAFTLTNEKGEYSLISDKRSGIVYISSMPVGYMMYEGSTTTKMEKIFAPYWQEFNYPASPNKSETGHNFRLKAVDNTNHIMLFLADPQLCGRGTGDLEFFTNHTIPRLKQEANDAGSIRIYSTHLGDLVFDEYWYKYNFRPASFKSKMMNDGYPMKIFPVMGNHDNDANIIASDSTDYACAKPWRTQFGPEYYSANIGQIHYIFIDDIIYKNTLSDPTFASYNTSIRGDRDYDTYVSETQMKWLERDLSYVDKNTPIFICMHAPLWGTNESYFTYALRSNPYGGTLAVCNLLKDFKKVEIFSGHRHKTYNCNPASFPNIREHSLGNVLGNLSWAGKYSGHPNCSDGTPEGYLCVNVYGTDYDWIWRDTDPGDDQEAQFRVIDINTWREFYNSDETYKLLPSAGHSYDNPNTKFSANTVLLNIFNHNPSWKIEVTENGTPLKVTQTFAQDVYHIIACDIPRYNASSAHSISDEMATWATHHMFYVKASSPTSTLNIKVTDEFGNEFTRNVTLPIPCTLEGLQAHNSAKMVTSITNTIKKNETATVYSKNSVICIDTENAGTAIIASLDGKVQTQQLAIGHNEIEIANRGIYVVKANGVTKKLLVK